MNVMQLFLNGLREVMPARTDFDDWTTLIAILILSWLAWKLRPVAMRRRQSDKMQTNVFRRPPL